MKFDYAGWLNTAKNRLAQLKQERTAIDAEISKLEKGIESFSPLLENDEPELTNPETVGITESVRRLFIENPTLLLTPTGIRDALLARGIALVQENPMATIHQILARLKEKQLIDPVEHPGKTCTRLAKSYPLPPRTNPYLQSTSAPVFPTHQHDLKSLMGVKKKLK